MKELRFLGQSVVKEAGDGKLYEASTHHCIGAGCVYCLRLREAKQLLGDKLVTRAEQQETIETEPRVGVKFVKHVELHYSESGRSMTHSFDAHCVVTAVKDNYVEYRVESVSNEDARPAWAADGLPSTGGGYSRLAYRIVEGRLTR